MRRLSSVTPVIFLLFIAACLTCGCTDGTPEDTIAISTPGPVDVEKETVRMVAVDDIRIAYKEFGEGEPLVFIMGYAGTMDMWDVPVLQKFAREYQVVIFDNRGMGHSTSSPKNYTIPLFANDTAEFMDAIGIEKAHVIGWSMGADIALELAHEHPERVDKLVLYAGDPGGNESVPMKPEVEETLLNTTGTAEERGMRLLSLLFPPEWMEQNPNPEVYLPHITETTDPENIGRQAEAMGMRNGTSVWLGNITAPTLLIVGDQDILAVPNNSFYIGQRIPSASVRQVRGGGHGLMYQFPDDFVTIVMTFFELEH